MKKFFFPIIAIVMILSFTKLSSQTSQGGIPQSFINNLKDDYELREYPAPDLSKIVIEDTIREKNGDFYRIGTSVKINAGISNSGTWTDIPGKGRIWRFMIKVENAKALSVDFDQFVIPSGGELFLYSYDKKQVIGAFTEINNDASQLFATELIKGDIVTLEYFEPLKIKGQALINISEVAYIYRGVPSFLNKDFGDSDNCEVNINCSEGSNWQDEKRGVARIFLKAGTSYGWCTGSLVNNVNQDCAPYFLTADHCGESSSTSDYNQWVFYFNYEASGCTTPTNEPSSQTITGATLKAHGGNGGDSGSDFILLRFNSSIPTSYNVYYNGWSNINSATSSGVCIHHPAGDIKKISTYSTTPATSDWNGSGINSHWEITWASTTNGYGVTEGGSSGSPLFNSNGLIIGDLTGGGSYCSTPTANDYYGKFAYSWSSNGTTAATRLKDWLDPNNTGATTLAGYYCGGTNPPQNSVCDTVTNMLSGEQLTMYSYTQQWGTWTGHGGYSDDKFADYHSGTTQNTKLQGLYLAVGNAYAATASSKITIKAWNSGSGIPGTEIGSADVLISSLNEGYWNYIPFNSPVTVGSDFYVGFQIYYNSPVDTFAIYNVADRGSSGVNTVYAYESGAWNAWSDWGLYSSLAIYAVVCPLSTESESPSVISNDITMNLFPNPSDGKFYITPEMISGDNLKISIYNTLGEKVFDNVYSKFTGIPISIDISNQPTGIYFVKMESGEKGITHKISILK